MLLHSIGRSEGPDATNPWIAKYIFPGGYIPALSEVLPVIERSGLLVCDIEILRLHYAETLKAWRERFMARREETMQLYDERFARMWEFYLACSEMAFRKQNLMNFQIQLTKRQGVVPMTRDYIARAEARFRAIENGRKRGSISWRRPEAQGETDSAKAHRPRKLRAQGLQDRGLAGLRAHFRARRLFHGVDEQRQPLPIAASALPWCESLTHLPSLFQRDRQSCRQRIPAKCELTHRTPGSVGLKACHGPKKTTAFIRHPR